MDSERMKIKNSHGLSIEFLENGLIKSIEAHPIRISLKPATLFSRSGANLFLRNRSGNIEYKVLLGPASDSWFLVKDNVYYVQGSWDGIEYQVALHLSEKSLSWQFVIDLTHRSGESKELDLICVQDVGLKLASDGLVNEYYVSQYLERRILEDMQYGAVVCCRQNMKEPTSNPWLMVVCRNGALSASTDGMVFYGKTYRENGKPEGLLDEILGGEYAGESSVIALQEKPFRLADGEQHRSVFISTFLPDHPQATSGSDLFRLPLLISEFDDKLTVPLSDQWKIPVGNLFNTSSFLPVEDLNEDELIRFFGTDRRHCEWEGTRLLSFFFSQNDHVVLRAKEIMADRPHGHILQTGSGYIPDENIMSTTCFAMGVFNSHLSQGNTNFNVLLSICTSQFNLGLEAGQRIFAEVEGRFYLLGIPSAFEMGLNHCRWIYKYGEHCLQVRTWTSRNIPQVNMDFNVLLGEPLNLIITHDFDALNGWYMAPGSSAGEFTVKPKEGSMLIGSFPQARFRIVLNKPDAGVHLLGNGALYPDHNGHGSPLFILGADQTSGFCMSFIGEVCTTHDAIRIDDADKQFLADCMDARSLWHDLSLNLSLIGEQPDIDVIREIMPWYGMNALTHFLTPYGLEQFSGAAWGTRDVAQGPIDMLLTMEKYDEAKQLLKIIFSNQNPDGGWPQWWMFDSYPSIRADSSHGDIFYWCIIALVNYIKITGDLHILEERLPYYQEKETGPAERTPLSEHVDRLIGMIIQSYIPGTALVPFDGGDWNDSLQPVSRELARRMISSWTVEMNYQAFNAYYHIYKKLGETEKAGELLAICDRIRADFNKYLIKDGVVAGYGLMEDNGSIRLLLHPSDKQTGIHYSILPMERGILSGIFTAEQARHHLDLIEQHLKGPDGARLMDRPLRYKGGIQDFFQRAESSTHFGREIGLMYVHEHIRYAESLACTGRADAFVKALRQAIPVGYRDIVPCADVRQANCYYSSSDVAFRNRYVADECYNDVIAGKMTLRGGWRVYSSGPGIFISLVVTRLLGLRIEEGNVIIDPVMPNSLDGLSASVDFLGRRIRFNYSIKDGNYSPKSILINGASIHFTLDKNSYRQGGAVVDKDQFTALLGLKQNVVRIRL